MVSEEKLTRVMDYIRRFTEENGYTPSVREIGKECGIKSTATVHSYIEKLQTRGLLNKTDNKKRAVTLGKGSGVTLLFPCSASLRQVSLFSLTRITRTITLSPLVNSKAMNCLCFPCKVLL